MAGRLIGVAVDGSDAAEKALMWAGDNLYREGDVILLIHAYEEVHHTPVLSDAIAASKAYKDEQEKIDNIVGALQAKLAGKKCRGVKCKIDGKIGESILKTSSDEKIDMLVTGTRGLGAVKRAFMGSVSDFVVRNATIPVVVYRVPEN